MIVHSQPRESSDVARAFVDGLGHPVSKSVMVVAAHPDDEIIGAGGHIHLWRHLTVVHVTDGAPADLKFAREAGFIDVASYAEARRQEARSALSIAGVPADKIIPLGFDDLGTSMRLGEITARISELFASEGPQIVVTHPYEGGHPDHDSTCFSVHSACEKLARAGKKIPVIVEMSSYFGRDGVRITSSFLTGSPAARTIALGETGRRQKQLMYSMHATQKGLLKEFPIDAECFRPAPEYDFTLAPHSGRLFYEFYELGMTGTRWRKLVDAANSDRER